MPETERTSSTAMTLPGSEVASTIEPPSSATGSTVYRRQSAPGHQADGRAVDRVLVEVDEVHADLRRRAP